MDKIKVFIASDDVIFQEGLRQFLDAEEDLDCMARTTGGEDAIRLAGEYLPDVVVMDLDKPLSEVSNSTEYAINVAKQLKAAHPSVAILMVSTQDHEFGISASLQSGIAGHLLKKASPREIVSAIRLLSFGEAVFNIKEVTKAIGELASNRGAVKRGVEQLSRREIDVLRAAAKGISNKEIGNQLGISERTVQTHLLSIFRKLETGSRIEAVLRALKEDWLTLDDLP